MKDSAKSILVSFLSVLVPLQAAAGGAPEQTPLPDLSVQELWESLRYAEGLFRTISVTESTEAFAWDGDPKSPPGERLTGPVELCYKRKGVGGGMEFWSITGPPATSGPRAGAARVYFASAYNGEFQTWYDEGRKQGVIAPKATMGMKRPVSYKSSRTFLGQPLSEYLSQSSEEVPMDVSIETTEVANSVPAYRVSVTNSNSRGTLESAPNVGPYATFWVVPRYGFGIVRWEWGNTAQKPSQRRYGFHEMSKYEEVAPGIWYPREFWAYQIVGEPAISHGVVESIAVNADMSDSEFTLRFPDGTQVHDRVRNAFRGTATGRGGGNSVAAGKGHALRRIWNRLSEAFRRTTR